MLGISSFLYKVVDSSQESQFPLLIPHSFLILLTSSFCFYNFSVSIFTKTSSPSVAKWNILLCLSQFISLRPFSSPNASSILKYCLLWNSIPFSLWNSFFVSTFYSLSCASCSMLYILCILLISDVKFFPKRILARLKVSSRIPALNWWFPIFRQKNIWSTAFTSVCLENLFSCLKFMSES